MATVAGARSRLWITQNCLSGHPTNVPTSRAVHHNDMPLLREQPKCSELGLSRDEYLPIRDKRD